MDISTLEQLNQKIADNSIIVQAVMISISVTCLAFLRIYLGVFLQVFMIAKYVRQYLAVEINKLIDEDTDRPLFYWENWLQKYRNDKKSKMGSVDIAIEPILMCAFSAIYAAFACYASYISTNSGITYTIGSLILVLAVLSVRKFYVILKDAVH